MKTRGLKKIAGFSLIEVLVGTAVFLVVAIAAYSAFASLFKLAAASQANILGVELADEQFEIVRNMPYVSVGLTNGIPLGIIPQTQTLSRGGYTFQVDTTVRNINLSTSTVQASDRLVEITISCPTCQSHFNPIVLTGQVSPANLQSAANGGAVVVQVFDGNGQPVEDANVTLQSVATSSVQDSDVTNNNGILNIIGVPPGTNMYRIIVTKSGYSTDRTYPIGGGNPNPTKPDATVLNQQVTNISFAIDRLSSLGFSSVDSLCTSKGSVHFTLTGAKNIGASLPKYSQNIITNGSGLWSTSTMEWDTYTVTPTDATYDFAGINPYSPMAVNAGNAQSVQLVVMPKNGNSLMVSVQDSTTKLPISGATVELSKSGYDQSQTTGQGYISQSDWSGGGGQVNMGTVNKYFNGNGVDTATASSTGRILLYWNAIAPHYLTNSTGTLESSTFDTGTTSNFYTFSWTPASQPALAGPGSVKFQFATKPTSTSTFSAADYLGPDGTSNSYFSVPGGTIPSALNGNEFARYMAYLTTNTATVTPSVADISFAYTSGCIPPGQVLFQGLSTGTYTLTVSKAGYSNYSNTNLSVGSGWQQQTASMAP